ncbi:MAG: sulfotransferase domain-containing protein [Parachlamydiaceae bacterium]|nr:sulfotransferase domain-containing protein [Parachlamydiaceae bacterium]
MKINYYRRLFSGAFAKLFFLLLATSFFGTTKSHCALPSQKFVIFTPPKCGTHLVCNVVSYMLGSAPLITDQFNSIEDVTNIIEDAKRNNQFLVSHSFTSEMLESLIKKNYKIIFILRDPRDQLISMMYWMKKGYWNEFTVSKIDDRSEQIDEMITGNIFGWSCYEGCIGVRMELLKSLPAESVYITRFETLVGPKGRGDQYLQNEEIQNIGEFLGLKLSTEAAQNIADHSFGGTWSFREGKIGAWKEHFLPHQIDLYKAIYSDLLIRLQYETTKDW